MDQSTITNIVLFVLSLVLTALGWFSREIWGALKDLRKDLHDLEVTLPAKYIAKDDFAEAMKDIKQDLREGFARMYDKLDAKADK